MASLESNSITAASGKVDTEALDLQAAVWGFTARKRFSAAPCCKHNSNRLCDWSSPQALRVDSWLATWQRRGAVVAKRKSWSSGDLRAVEDCSYVYEDVEAVLEDPSAEPPAVPRWMFCARTVRCDADTRGRLLRASCSKQLLHISLTAQGVGDRSPGRLCPVFVR